ncbi:unnamed protein product [Spodoptera littoralis]|uniref:MADF domain-containing protein n=1 Tax=Spodoptera littoralis TaxID=7109 RepID=A0A9P0IJP6_SPOLI|nr:unnamed protein product [Spodoptera littoralis]CAH1647044.1 unnamed protein product [Spodoptera littoralis]
MRERYRYNWTKSQRKLINLVKEYNICEKMLDKSAIGLASAEVAWDKLSNEAQVNVYKCRRMWHSISMIYKRLKLMILEGNLSEFEVRKNYKVAKYVDGSLDFLDPFILDASEKQISEIKTHKNTKKSLSKLLGYDIDKKKSDCGNDETSSVSSEESVVEEPGISTENDCRYRQNRRCGRSDLANFIVKHSFSNKKPFTLQTYMDDLGLAVCSIQQPKERRLLIKEIDSIVSDLLQGN